MIFSKGISLSLLLFVFFLSTVLFCNAQTVPCDNQVIFEEGKSVKVDILEGTAFKRFTPTEMDIDSADSFLQHYFLKIKASEGKHPQVENYFRQYVGVAVYDRKCIFVNALCWKPDYYLENTYSPQKGVGCYFQSLVDINSGEVLDIHFRGTR